MSALIAHWFFWFTGARNESGTAYGLMSGAGGAVPDVMIPAGMIAWYWHRTCHVKRCPRLGRHPVKGTSYVVCARHRPGGAPTHGEVLDAHRDATQSGENR